MSYEKGREKATVLQCTVLYSERTWCSNIRTDKCTEERTHRRQLSCRIYIERHLVASSYLREREREREGEGEYVSEGG